MSWRSEPPEYRTIECRSCEGKGTIIEARQPPEECGVCDGEGRIEFDPSDDPYAPDTWKEAEGIA